MPADPTTSTRDAAVRARRHRRTCARRGLRIACVVVVVVVGVLTVGVSQRVVSDAGTSMSGSSVGDDVGSAIGGGRGRGLRVGGSAGGSVGPSGDAVRERVVVVDDGDDVDDVDKALGRRGGRATATPSTKSASTTSYWARVAADPKRRDAVRAAAREAFGAFWKSALGHDELAPASGTGRDDFGGIDATLIDSLDTLHLMGLTKEFENALLYLKKPDSNFRRLIRGERDKDVSVFETNIRVLGGLLSTYDLTGDPDVLDLAESMASRLSAAFDTKSGVPTSFVNVKTGKAFGLSWTNGRSILADFGTMHLEWATLSARSNNPVYEAHTNHVFERVAQSSAAQDGLYPHLYDQNEGRFTGGVISFGALGDSFYEYLIKCWRSLDGLKDADAWRGMFDKAMEGMKKKLLHQWKVGENGELYSYLSPVGGGGKMEHLACFVPGMLVLGAAEAPTPEVSQDYLEIAKNVARTCVAMYDAQPTGLAPDHFALQTGSDDVKLIDKKNIQRPETIESLFYLFRKTGDEQYREQAWRIFQSMKKAYRTRAGGWQGVRDVSHTPPQGDDKMQSFFLAETLKYLYLLYCDDSVMHLDEWVFNTEAHPFKVTRNNKSM